MDEEEHIQYEEEEFTAIYRKTKRTKSTKRRKNKASPSDSMDALVKTEIKLNPFLQGTKGRTVYKPGPEEGQLKADMVQKLVKETLNQCSGPDVTAGVQRPNRLFLGQCESDDDDTESPGSDGGGRVNETRSCTVWRCKKTGRKGFDRFRRIVEFVIIARQVFTVRSMVHLNRRDSILFFMNRDPSRQDHDEDSKPKFDLNAFKGLGQKTKTASIKACLDVPTSERTDALVNQMVHQLKQFQKFSNYPQAVQTGLCRQGWYAKFDSSKVLVKEGCKAEFYYFILSGVAVYRNDEAPVTSASNKPVTSLLKPGDTLGSLLDYSSAFIVHFENLVEDYCISFTNMKKEKEILTGAERPATVVCKEEVEVLGVDRDTLLSIFESSGGVAAIEFLRHRPEFCDLPLDLLKTYHFSLSTHFYKRGTVIVKNNHESEWVYIVRSGSCQVYKTVRDTNRHKESVARSTNRNTPRERRDDKLVLPDINRTKKDKLRSASTDNIQDTFGKNQKSRKMESIERSNTVLPNLVPGKTSLVRNNAPKPRTCFTPTLPHINPHNKENNRHRNRIPSDSPKSVRKIYSETPENHRLSINKLPHCGTPDLTMSSTGSQNSPRQEPLSRLSLKKKGSNSSGGSRRKHSISSDREHSARTSKNNDDSVFTNEPAGPLAYVRLDVIAENGVFGLHTLIHDDTPTLSLVSNGAECLLVSKKFLKDHLDENILHKLKTLLTPYPGAEQLRHALDDRANWDLYRGKVVDDVVLS